MNRTCTTFKNSTAGIISARIPKTNACSRELGSFFEYRVYFTFFFVFDNQTKLLRLFRDFSKEQKTSPTRVNWFNWSKGHQFYQKRLLGLKIAVNLIFNEIFFCSGNGIKHGAKTTSTHRNNNGRFRIKNAKLCSFSALFLV